jgi:hypothetical protein
MDRHYYESLRNAAQEDYYEAINNPDHELYDLLWDLFETVVIEPGEVFDPDFGSRNQFRYSIDTAVAMEFFPSASYYEKRLEPNPYKDGSDSAGIHLRFSILPEMTCLFSVALRVWGRAERLAFKRLWRDYRPVIADLLERSNPMVATRISVPKMDFSSSLEQMMDRYFAVQDSENFIELRYPFAQLDETAVAQNFMTYMALIFYSIRDLCQIRKSHVELRRRRLNEFYSGHLPTLPHPLPCVEMVYSS